MSIHGSVSGGVTGSGRLARRIVYGRASYVPSASGTDHNPPEIRNLEPVAGSGIYALQTIIFEIVDDTGLLFVEVQVNHGAREVVHDGDQFLAPYLTSIRYPITNGWAYQIRRSGGWRVSPEFLVRAIDVSANMGGS